jgi:hypothetical protein
MKGEYLNKLLLGIIALLLLMNFMQGLFSANTASAQNDSEQIGRYQVSAWAAQSGRIGHHSGYYVIDTITGKLVDSKAETHTTKE